MLVVVCVKLGVGLRVEDVVAVHEGVIVSVAVVGAA